MIKWLCTALILISFVALGCAPKPQEDCGIVQNVYGERISWKRDVPVTMYLHEDVPDSMVPAIVSAAESWEKTAGRKLIHIVTSPRHTGPIAPNKDGVNVIYFMKTWEDNRGAEQGRTSVYWIGDLIKEADIRLNGSDFGFYWKDETLTKAAKSNRAYQIPVNFEALVLHELGHVLGLKHKDGAGSVMATYLASGEDRVNVSGVDEVALQCEY